MCGRGDVKWGDVKWGVIKGGGGGGVRKGGGKLYCIHYIMSNKIDILPILYYNYTALRKVHIVPSAPGTAVTKVE